MGKMIEVGTRVTTPKGAGTVEWTRSSRDETVSVAVRLDSAIHGGRDRRITNVVFPADRVRKLDTTEAAPLLESILGQKNGWKIVNRTGYSMNNGREIVQVIDVEAQRTDDKTGEVTARATVRRVDGTWGSPFVTI